MSLVPLALRIITTRMLAGQTWAGSNIYDSPVDPVSGPLEEAFEPGQPWIAIYVSDNEVEVVERQTQGTKQSIDLVLYSYMPMASFTVDTIKISTRDEGGAAALDIIGRQVEAAMRFGPSPWVDLWKKFVVSIGMMKTRPVLVQLETGTALQCRETIISLTAIPDPQFGMPVYGYWTDLFTAMAADPAAAPLVPLMTALITDPANLPDWREAMALLDSSYPAMRAAGLTPQDPTQITDDAAALGDIELVGPHDPQQ